MKKIYLLTLVLFCSLVSQAQFVGYYNLQDGGVDSPSSSLFVLPNNEFMIFYLGGFKRGTWKEIDKNKIELSEVKLNTNPVQIYGKTETTTDKNLKVDVAYLSRANAFIRFSKDTNFQQELTPVFNDWPNCMKDQYVITKPLGQFNYVNVSLPSNPEFGKFGVTYPYKVASFTFPLDKKFTHFTLLYNEEAQQELMIFTFRKSGDDYSIDYFGEPKKLSRLEFDEEMRQEIDQMKTELSQFEKREDLGVLIASISAKTDVISKPPGNPLFTAECAKDNTEVLEEVTPEKDRELKSIQRENGVYTVSNYDQTNIKLGELTLAKVSSLSQKDFQSAVKQVSDYDGYEIKITFTKKGSQKFLDLLDNNPQKPVAFVIDNKIVDFYFNFLRDAAGTARIGHGISEKQIDLLIKNINKK